MARKKKEPAPELPKLKLCDTRVEISVVLPTILTRNGSFHQLGPRKSNLYPVREGDISNTKSDLVKKCSDLAMSNHLDIQYRTVEPNEKMLTVGLVSDEFLRDLALIIGFYAFSCILYDPNKDLTAVYQWPGTTAESFKIADWVKFDSKRIVWILGLWNV